MLKLIGILLTGVLTSFYFFPFEFVFLPGINTKMAMAGAGLVVLGYKLAKGQRAGLDKDIFQLSIIGLIISLLSVATAAYHNTTDYSFATYFMSMWVWLGAAYALINCMKAIHGKLSIPLVAYYLIGVCVAQCVLALTMNMHAPLKEFVDSFLGGEDAFMGKAGDRMYGIGCALDVAGFRFAAVLCIIAYLGLNEETAQKWKMGCYILAFLVLAVIGNMIGRSTTIGLGIALCYTLYVAIIQKKDNGILWWKWLLSIFCICLPIIVFFYHNDPLFKENIRFGFEGFFSLAETGEWRTNSTDIYQNNMLVFPETMETWIFGDGYCANPKDDPYYTGEAYHGFYKGTDIGYLRFIFYFGIIGASALVLYIWKATMICMNRFPGYKMLFMLLFVVNMVEWLKVSTDIFIVFAPFLCVYAGDSTKKEEENTNGIAIEESVN